MKLQSRLWGALLDWSPFSWQWQANWRVAVLATRIVFGWLCVQFNMDLLSTLAFISGTGAGSTGFGGIDRNPTYWNLWRRNSCRVSLIFMVCHNWPKFGEWFGSSTNFADWVLHSSQVGGLWPFIYSYVRKSFFPYQRLSRTTRVSMWNLTVISWRTSLSRWESGPGRYAGAVEEGGRMLGSPWSWCMDWQPEQPCSPSTLTDSLSTGM